MGSPIVFVITLMRRSVGWHRDMPLRPSRCHIPLNLALQRHLHRHTLQHNELWALHTLMPLVTGP
jgi:hypothetical protein